MEIRSIIALIIYPLYLLVASSSLAQNIAVPEPRPQIEEQVPLISRQNSEAQKPDEKRVYQAACPAVLSGQVTAKKLAPVTEGDCGERSPLGVEAISGIKLSAKAVLNCRMATTLATWVQEANAQSQKDFGVGISTILSSTSYQCRRRNNAPDGKISEHGFANAFDLVGFKLGDGRTISVLEDWSVPTAQDDEESEIASEISVEGKFLRSIRTQACAHFTTVLSPDSDPHHADHFHFDLGCHGKTCTYKICQ